MAAHPYKRLPGRSRGFLSISSLWEAGDHLLLVESHRVSESYKRFFYRDIQAMVVCQTDGGLITNVIFSVLAVIVGLAGIAAGSATGIVLGVFAGLFFLFALIGYLRGPTCRCMLRTAVQTQLLPSLNRVRTARKVLLRLQPKISDAQQEPLPR